MPNRTQKMRRALMRVNTRLLLSAVMLFQFAALALAAFRGETTSVQTLILAFAVPIITMLVALLAGRLWPVDRAILILVLFLHFFTIFQAIRIRIEIHEAQKHVVDHAVQLHFFRKLCIL